MKEFCLSTFPGKQKGENIEKFGLIGVSAGMTQEVKDGVIKAEVRDLKIEVIKKDAKNAIVKTPSGEGKVLNMQYLTQLIVVQFEDGRREAFGLEDLEILPKRPQNQNQNRDNNAQNNNRDNNSRNNNHRQEQVSKEKQTPENSERSQPAKEKQDIPMDKEDTDRDDIKNENNQNDQQDNSNKQEQ